MRSHADGVVGLLTYKLLFTPQNRHLSLDVKLTCSPQYTTEAMCVSYLLSDWLDGVLISPISRRLKLNKLRPEKLDVAPAARSAPARLRLGSSFPSLVTEAICNADGGRGRSHEMRFITLKLSACCCNRH